MDEPRLPESLYPKVQVSQFCRERLTSLTRMFARGFNGSRRFKRITQGNIWLRDLVGILLPKGSCLTSLSMMAICHNPHLLCLAKLMFQSMCKLQLLQSGLHCHNDAWLWILVTHCEMIMICPMCFVQEWHKTRNLWQIWSPEPWQLYVVF